MTSARWWRLAALAALLSACGSSGGAGASGGAGGTASGSGGSNATGGGSGGSAPTGGSAGRVASGGTTGTGGAPGTGGTTSTGGSGGTSTTGGVGGHAGAGAGGTGGKAGASGTGGTAGRGGTSGTGGSAGASGGTPGTGGTTGTGGTGAGNAPGGATAVYPPVNGTNVCPDPQLRITFAGAPSIGSSGKFQVFTSGGSLVSAVDVAAATTTTVNGGLSFTLEKPVFVDGNTVVVYLPSKPLTYGQTYYVTVDAGAIKPPSGTFSVSGSTAWRFTTAAAAPASKTAIGVALDGSAPFCSLQGALDFIPANNTTATTVSIANGVYHEIVYFKSKSNVTIQGASQNGTVFAAVNNDNLNAGTKARAMIGGDSTSGLTITNMTIHNLTPQGGSQAEALRLESCDQCVITSATIISLQDTLLWSGRLYAKNCLIEGNVDYVWGKGAAYFDSCEIRTIGRTGVIVQARNPASSYGYVFVDCKITSDSGLTGIALARIDASVYPASQVAYINCQLSSGIAATGWTITGSTDTSMLRFWEYQSVDPSGQPINTSQRVAGSKQISASQAAMMRDPTVVLAGWQPPGT